MFQKLFTRRRGVAMATVALGLSGMSLAFAGGTAGAVTQSVLPASGSNTTYYAMTALSVLFDESPGCDLAGNTHPFDGSCAIPYATGTTVNQPGEDGSQAAKENPYNDDETQLAAVGSGQGVKELYTAGSIAEAYARASSNVPAAIHTTAAQNVISYAIDGVPWTHFVDGGTGAGSTLADAPTTTINNIGLTQLQQAYADTLTCPKPGGGTLTMVWYCLNPTEASAASNKTILEGLHIDCYMAQTGSGTEGTWKQFVTLGTDTPACLNDEWFGPGGVVGSRGTAAQKTAANLSHIGLFENEVSSIVNTSSVWYNEDFVSNTHNTNKAAALYFYSYGKYTSQCPTNFCPGTTVGANKYKTAEGEINSVTASKTSIQGTGGGIPGNFPIIRYLANVYNNTSTGTNGVVSQAALNAIGEDGFLCKKQTTTDIDPLTGVNYRSEIEAAITANGFFPIDTSPSHPFSQGALTTTVPLTDSNYQLVDPSYTSTNPSGFCLDTNG